MGVIQPRPFPTLCLHIALLFFLKWIALRLMFPALQMEHCLLSMTDDTVRDLQRLSGNKTAKVGHISMKEIKELRGRHQFLQEFDDHEVLMIEDALTSVSRSVRQVILDAKVGPPSYEQGLARDIISVVEKTRCRNCLVWAKSDSLVRDVINLSSDATVGYIVMKDPSTGVTTNLLRMKGATVVGVYHSLINEKLVKILHGSNKKVYAWTVDDQVSMHKILLEHVDGIVTSNPTLLQHVMQEIRTQCLEEGFPFPRLASPLF
ncbi:glycerophosphodiester phosphodiesterase GDPD4-like isoform X2 [Macadamia integrifolia]|uniref:glycerophosphodiester phosphodiesterase GDPD4-like isoform X2 n=1 Tax=Macadamia integrifolia TaxID=60698 RepID=UPI001C52D6DD|nr:glycerophosphodiester phosphodiesterase GDPD4-like isoform X2 [Macadamia integrifolia]